MPKEHHKKTYVTFLETMIYHILFIYSVVDVTYLAKLVPVTPISLWFMVDLSYIYIYGWYSWGLCANKHHWGGTSLWCPAFLDHLTRRRHRLVARWVPSSARCRRPTSWVPAGVCWWCALTDDGKAEGFGDGDVIRVEKIMGFIMVFMMGNG